MISAKTTKTLGAAVAVAAVGMTAAPASAATHQPAPGTAKLHGFVPRSTSATAVTRATGRTAEPDSVGRCPQYGTDVKECAHITGSFNYVSYMSIYSACVTGAGIWVHAEIVSPLGAYVNGGSYYRSNGNCIPSLVYAPFTTVNPGSWKFRIWRKNSNGTFTKVDEIALTVDA